MSTLSTSPVIAFDLDHVADLEGAFAEQEKSADQVAERGLRGETDGDGQHAGGAEQYAELETELLQRPRQADAEHAPAREPADQLGALRVAAPADQAPEPAPEQARDQERRARG